MKKIFLIIVITASIAVSVYAQQQFTVRELDTILYERNPYMIDSLNNTQVTVTGVIGYVSKAPQGYPVVYFRINPSSGNLADQQSEMALELLYNKNVYPLACFPQENEPELKKLLKNQKRTITGIISFVYPQKETYYHVRIDQCKFVK